MSIFRLSLRQFSDAPAAFQAAILMVIGCFFLAGLGGLIKYLADSGMHVFEIVFLRNLAGLIVLLPWFIKNGVSAMKTKRPKLYVIRAIFGFISMLSWFWAITTIPLAEAVALNFTAPIFGTLLAIFVLHEVVRMRRWMAIIVGFLGAMIILRPGTIDPSTGTYLALFAAATMACSITCVKMLSRTESTPAMVAWAQIIILPMSLIPAIFVWEMPSPEALVIVAGMGLCATFGHLFFTRAYAIADATYVMPFDFSRLIFSAIIGFFFFAQEPDVYVWVGAAVIFASSVYIAMREAKSTEREEEIELKV